MIEVEIGNTGQIVEFPDGTSPDVMRQALAKFQSVATSPVLSEDVQIGEANDISNRSVSDIPDVPIPSGDNAQGSSASPSGGGDLQSGLGDLGNAALEIMAGVNRGALSLADLPAGFANAILQLSGTDTRVPTLMGSEAGQAGAGGGFVEDPVARQALGMAGEFLSPGLPVKALSGVDDVTRLADDLISVSDDVGKAIPQSAAKQAIAQKIKDNPGSIEVGKYLVTGAGKVKTDKLYTKAIKQGFNKGVLSAVKGSKPLDKRRMKEMIHLLKKGRDDAKFAAKHRPADIAGKSLKERVDYIKTLNKSSGKAIDEAASGLKGKLVDLDKPVSAFAKQMDSLGVKLADDGQGGFKPDFADSVLSPGDRGPIKEVFRQMSRLGREGEPDAFSAHQLKRIIDNNVTFGKTKTGLSGDAGRALKEFRVGLDEVLDNKFPAYNKANTDYSQTIGALDSLQKAAGSKVDLFGPNTEKALGTTLRRLLNNTQSRVNLIDAIDEMEAVARVTNKSFDDDVLTQVMFVDELDSMFGAAGKTSFKGQIEQALETGTNAARRGLVETSIDAGSSLAKKVAGVNEDGAIKAIEDFLGK